MGSVLQNLFKINKFKSILIKIGTKNLGLLNLSA